MIHIRAETKSTIMTNEHTSLEKYTSHTVFEMVAKGLCVRGELETEQTATYWPPVPLSSAVLLSRSAGLLNRRSWGSIALCWVLVLSAASYLQLQLTEPVYGTGLYNCLTYTCFLWASHLYPIQPVHSQGYTLIIFDRMHLFLDWRLGRRSVCYKNNKQCPIVFNRICLNNNLLHKCTLLNIYIYVCVCVCVWIYISSTDSLNSLSLSSSVPIVLRSYFSSYPHRAGQYT